MPEKSLACQRKAFWGSRAPANFGSSSPPASLASCSLLLIVHFSLHYLILFTFHCTTQYFSLHYKISITSPLVHTSTQRSRARQSSLFLPKFQLVVAQQLATRWHAAEKFPTPTHYYLRGQRRCIAAFFILKSTWSQTSHVPRPKSTASMCDVGQFVMTFDRSPNWGRFSLHFNYWITCIKSWLCLV